MHTVQILLNTKACSQAMEKRFRAMTHIHNVCVKHGNKLLSRLGHDKTYQDAMDKRMDASKKLDVLQQKAPSTRKEERELEKRVTAMEKEIKSINKTLNTTRMDMGLSESGFESWLKKCGSRFSHLVSSQQVQAEAGRVWAGVEKVLFGNGTKLHYKKEYELSTITGKSNTNGAKFHPETMTVEWTGLTLACKLPNRISEQRYIAEALQGTIAYCTISRKMFPSGWRYYALVCVRSDAPVNGRTSGKGPMGIDPGTSTMAAVSDEAVFLEELAPRVPEYNRQIRDLQYRMDVSKRMTNPGKYHEDGTINRKNHDRWVFSKGYKRMHQKLRAIYRKKAAYIKQDHEERVNRFLAHADTIYIEHMDYRALQKRARDTSRKEDASPVKQKDGTVRLIRKFKKKKRFGRSLNNRTPASFITILKRKAGLLGVTVLEIQTRTYKASQYNHVTGECVKTLLSERKKKIDGHTVQRDLYSAFLIQNPSDDLVTPDRQACKKRFQNFLQLQGHLIHTMKSTGQSMPQCFGF